MSVAWEDYPSTATPITAARLNQMQQFVDSRAEDADAAAVRAEAAADAAEAPTDAVVDAVLNDPGTDAGATFATALKAHSSFLDDSAGTVPTFRIADVPGMGSSLINIHHYGDTVTNPDRVQNYALNIANHEGAATAFVIHQYSATGPAIQIDNTDVNASIYIKNTENPTENPGGVGTGAFLQLLPYGESATFFISDSLKFQNNTTKNVEVVTGSSSLYAFGVRATANIVGLQVTKSGTGSGDALAITNSGTGLGVHISQTGSGIPFRITNSGANAAAAVYQATTKVFQIHGNGEVELYSPGAGLVVANPSGARYKISVNNAGTLIATAL